MLWVWENAEKLGNLMQIATMLAALIAAALVYFQILSAQRDQQESTAKQLYQEYLTLAFHNPQFANPNKQLIQEYKYRWFAAILLNSCEEILHRFPQDKTWRKVIAAELEYHDEYLKSDLFLGQDEDRGWSLYSSELNNVFVERDKILRS